MILILSADWADDVDLSTERVLRAFFMCICGLGICQLSEDELLRALSEKSRLHSAALPLMKGAREMFILYSFIKQCTENKANGTSPLPPSQGGC